MENKIKKSSMSFNVLIKKEPDYYIAHCLELDIVATASSIKSVQGDIIDLIKAQVGCAFSNDNLDNLYHPAPPEVWKEFFACKKAWEKKTATPPVKDDPLKSFLPAWIIATMCQPESCHA